MHMSRTMAAAAATTTTTTTTTTTISSNEIASTSNTHWGSSLHPFVTQKLVDTGKYYCPFLERGFCRELTRCNFSHDNDKSIKIPTEFCHFYLANKCLYSQECKFIHGEPLIPPIDDAMLNIANLNLTDNNNHDNFDHENYQYYYDCEEADNLGPEMVNVAYEHDSQVPKQINVSIRLTGNGLINCLSGKADSDATSSQMHKNKSKTPSSSFSNDNKNKAFVEDKHTANPSSTSSTSKSSTNLLAIRALVVGDPTSSHSGGDIASTRSVSSKATTNATKAWQGGRILASFKAETSGNQGAQLKDLPLCPYAAVSGDCPYADGVCTYLHGQVCDLCCMPCLHPYDEAQRRQHRDDCLLEHEREMELSFAVQRSKDKICGICMETVVEKKPITSSRFGILEKCNHIFCLDCIRKWRGTKQFDSKTIRACPECRVNSDFVVPSKYWIEDQDDKDKLIHDYKAALRSKPCRYFNEGMGECPFAGSCFYKHAYPDGRLAEMSAPKPRRRVYGPRGATSLANYVLWSWVRSFDDDDWSNDNDSESHYYIGDDDNLDNINLDDDDDDDYEDDEEENHDNEANVIIL